MGLADIKRRQIETDASAVLQIAEQSGMAEIWQILQRS